MLKLFGTDGSLALSELHLRFTQGRYLFDLWGLPKSAPASLVAVLYLLTPNFLFIIYLFKCFLERSLCANWCGVLGRIWEDGSRLFR
jgi:hypothetical protein